MRTTNYLWMDMKTTGPDKGEDRIIEVAAILTDRSLEGLDTYTTVVDPHPFDYIERLSVNVEVQHVHIRSGLVGDLMVGHGIPVERAERSIIDMIPTKGKSTMLAGSGVVEYQRSWLATWMPRLEALLPDDMIDVAMLRHFMVGVCKREDLLPDGEDPNQRALGDLTAHLDEMRHYQSLMVHVPEYGYV